MPEKPTPAMDPEFVAFLRERLTEESVAATRRQNAAAAQVPSDAAPSDAAPSQEAPSDEARQLLDELITGLDRGTRPDRTSLHLLLYAYARHPDFRPQWLAIG